MTQVLLLAKTFIRQNRWLLIALVGWPVLMAVLVGWPRQTASPADFFDVLQQEAIYGLVVVAFLASSAIHNEKRSRRIVGVLSKSVSRMQYLLALLLGSAGFAAVYALAIDVSVLWSLGFSGSTVRFAAAFFCTFVSAAFWLAALALCLSTFMLPFLAATLSGAAGLLPLLSTYTPVTWSPVAALLKAATSSASSIQSLAIALAVLEAAVFVICGAAIFSRRDVTVSIE